MLEHNFQSIGVQKNTLVLRYANSSVWLSGDVFGGKYHDLDVMLRSVDFCPESYVELLKKLRRGSWVPWLISIFL